MWLNTLLDINKSINQGASLIYTHLITHLSLCGCELWPRKNDLVMFDIKDSELIVVNQIDLFGYAESMVPYVRFALREAYPRLMSGLKRNEVADR